MKVMILAAGRGTRLRPLTNTLPKPLVPVGGQPLIIWHLQALKNAGFYDIVINAAWLAGALQAALGDGSQFGLRIRYSLEIPGQLDTGGGIKAALPLLGEQPFAVVSADAWTDFDFARFKNVSVQGCHLVLAPNPAHHPGGDFGLENNQNGGRIISQAPRYTYTGMGVFSPQLFRDNRAKRFSLARIIHAAIDQHTAYGQLHTSRWIDVGRPESLQQANDLAAHVN